jgi:uncharacterized repeat protein (TIGR04138 family)
MSLRDDLAGILARDPRYSIHAYAFVFEALEHTKHLRKQRARAQNRAQSDAASTTPKPTRGRTRRGASQASRHVTGAELCFGARDLATRHYGLLAITVLAQWGIRSTSDLGEIVYNLIESGDFERTPTDHRSDFDRVFDFETALRREYVVALDDVA